MAEKLERLQVYIDQNTYRVLVEMGKKQMRGQNESRVAASILENWVWENHEQLERKGIPYGHEPSKDKSK